MKTVSLLCKLIQFLMVALSVTVHKALILLTFFNHPYQSLVFMRVCGLLAHFPTFFFISVREKTIKYGKCEKRMLSCFSKLSTHIQNFKEGPLKKIDKPILEKRVNSVVDSFSRGTESEILQSIRSVLHASRKGTECYVSSNGDLYLRKAS